jgi:large repetitive protein
MAQHLAAPVSDQLNITLLPVTEGNLPSSAIICNDPENPNLATRSVTLDPGDSFESFVWSTGAITQTIVADQPGIYTVDLINLFGCPSTDQTEVTVECDPLLNAPNAFKPSSTVLQNDYFSVYPIFVSSDDFQVFIFNRWGEMVYQSNKLDFKWNGTYNNNGLPLPPGTYSWVAKYKSSYRPEDGMKEKHGGVVLMR